MKFKSDIDIDFGDRTKVIELLKPTPASIHRSTGVAKHNTGVYFQKVPTDPYTGLCSIDHKESEDRGYIKLDLLNVHVYQQVKDEAHLTWLLETEPEWDKLYDKSFCEQLIHINEHFDTLIRMPEAVNTIPRLAMFLAVIRPSKRHLIGQKWKEVAQTVWDKPDDESYYFKKSHSVAYANLVVVHMNLISFPDQGNASPLTTSGS